MLLKVVCHYDLSVQSMSLMGSQKKLWIGRWVGGVSSIHLFGISLNFVNFAKPFNIILFYAIHTNHSNRM